MNAPWYRTGAGEAQHAPVPAAGHAAHSAAAQEVDGATQRPGCALRAQGLQVSLGGTSVLQGVDLCIATARWTSIVGPNGAGKSTLLKALAGLLPAQGRIWLQERELSGWPARERARTLAWLGQGEAAGDDLRVQDVVMLGRLPWLGWLGAPAPADHAAVEEALRLTQAWTWRERSLGQLSGGERQRVLLARALALQAPLLLLDEPLANLDPPHQADWMLAMRALVARGCTVLSVLHELPVALQADELIVLQQGRVLHQGPSAAPATHSALAAVFEQRILIGQLQGQWLAVPQATHAGQAAA